ncbi:hypothetical protein Csa_016465 [Cucumis sativus]|uniref:Uncharacterized protein n=1 Tax=Cucumis sativus TaxID=3659 RepID=A0A0A0KBR5_CUCSA|nr:hypothetical protein Csa_016465 [Cucumis sativus]
MDKPSVRMLRSNCLVSCFRIEDFPPPFLHVHPLALLKAWGTNSCVDIQSSLNSCLSVCNALITMYFKCGSQEGISVFDQSRHNYLESSFSWLCT